ncbi:MAG: AsnC family protein [Gammaproteobacteria bacterium]
MSAARQTQAATTRQSFILSPCEKNLLTAIQTGLPLVRRPFLAVAKRIGASEADVIHTLRNLLTAKIIKRLGVIVRHRQLGYTANAMVVWDVPDAQIEAIGQRMSEFDFVTLCYQRPRRLPQWPYNLFCMIHGRDRTDVQQQLARLRAALELHETRHDVLFSRRCFKQRGACYTSPSRGDEHGRAA